MKVDRASALTVEACFYHFLPLPTRTNGAMPPARSLEHKRVGGTRWLMPSKCIRIGYNFDDAL